MRSPKALHPVVLLLALACLLPSAPSRAANIFVAVTGSDATGDGSLGNPYQTIQFAHDQAAAGDTVLVGPGTYNECVFLSEFPTDKPVQVIAQDWLSFNNNTTTIIDGTGLCDEFSFSPGAAVLVSSSGTRFEGFTVTGGGRGGIRSFGSVVITNNLVTGNYNTSGGGILFYSSACYYGLIDAHITNNNINNNQAQFLGTALSGEGGDGGGIWILAEGVEPGGAFDCMEGAVNVTVQGNTITSNTAQGIPERSALGGGLVVFTNSEDETTVDVQVTQNIITGNVVLAGTAGYGGGAWMSTYGYGQESIVVSGNTFASNTAPSDGGGMSGWIDHVGLGRHSMTIDGNTITGNSASNGGGGLDAFLWTRDHTLTDQSIDYSIRGNTFTGNSSGGTSGGGGILATTWSWRSSGAPLDFALDANRVASNTASVAGGGVSLLFDVDEDPPADPAIPFPSEAEIQLTNNLIVGNQATQAGAAVGGAVFTQLVSYGRANASATFRLNTIVDNSADTSAAGIEIVAATGFVNTDEGLARVSVLNSIFATNSGLEIAGPEPGVEVGSGNLNLGIFFNDFYDPAVAALDDNFEPWVVTLATPSTPGFANVTDDPLFFDPGTLNYRLQQSSPLIDSGDNLGPGDLPDFDFEGDPRIVDGSGAGTIVDLGYDEFYDTDGDGLQNNPDNCPDDPNADQQNSDGDVQGDVCDNCPLTTNPTQSDTDGDTDGDECDLCTDTDNDTFGNPGFPFNTCGDDNCPDDFNDTQVNSDTDTRGDACDNCPNLDNEDQANADGDGDGDVCDACTDTDGDTFGNPGFPDNTCPDDNCPDDFDDTQANSDSDTFGDVCDNCPDLDNQDQANGDGDSLGDLCDNCPLATNEDQADLDSDGPGDACDICTDTDGDTFGNPGFPANTCPDDNCPLTFNDQADFDADGAGDDCDQCTDTDRDGFGNPQFPLNNCPLDNCPQVINPDQTDTDLDAIGDVCDLCTDTDGDGFGNPLFPVNTCPTDNCPLDFNDTQANSDTDTLGDACDNCTVVDNDNQANNDGDTRGDACDNCPNDTNEDQANFDGDSLGDACDTCTDTDGDGFGNPGFGGNSCADDNCPDDFNDLQTNSDGDTLGDACDNCPNDTNEGQANSDTDTVGDACDNCQFVDNDGQGNADDDTVGDACDSCTDTDGDGFGNPGFPANTCGTDNCPDVFNDDQTDSDDDGIGDACEIDTDSDGIEDVIDNCPTVFNPLQENADGDADGDVCDPCTDLDGDGAGDPGFPANTCPLDNCLGLFNDQADFDADGAGDVCDSCTDPDGDGFGSPNFPANTCPDDNCPDAFNDDQADLDGDGPGDACDTCTDTDDDGFGDPGFPANTCGLDNCPDVSNPDQADGNDDGIGDACACMDLDGDGFGTGDPPLFGCEGGIFPDCNDASAEIFPGAPEICDGIDNDCNLARNDAICDELDVDGDGRIFGGELSWIGKAFNSSTADGPGPYWWALIDYNKDGRVDGDDLAILSLYWGCNPGQNVCNRP